MTATSMNEKVRKLKELDRWVEEIEAEKEAIKDELKKEMELRQVDEISTNEYKIRYKSVTCTI